MAKDSSSSLMTLGLVAVGGYFAYEYFIAPSAVGPVPPGGTGVSPSGAGSPSGAVSGAPAAVTNWAGIYASLIAATIPDTNFTGSGGSRQSSPYRWNFYLSRLVSTPLPDLAAVFPGVDPNADMTAATYWSGMGAALGAPAASLPSPVSAGSGSAGVSTSPARQAPGYGVDQSPLTYDVAGAIHDVRGTTTVRTGGGVLAGFGAISCADVDPTFMGPQDCVPTQQQNQDFISSLEDSYNALAASIQHPAAVAPTGLAAVPWWAWAGGAALFVAVAGSGGRR